jgi:tetratricopeptide (TPR) repeat protein
VYIQQLAEIEGTLGHPKEEANLWQQYLLYAPNPVEGCLEIGTAYLQGNRIDRAIASLERCRDIDPNNPDVLFHLGSSYERNGESVKAQDYYLAGLRTDPDNTDLHLGMGRIQLRTGKIDEAAASAATVLAKYPQNTDALLLAGIAAMRLDELPGARRHLEQAKDLAPRYSDVYLALGQLAEREKNLPQALAEYHHVLDLAPNEPTAKGRIALLEQGKK